MTTKRKKPRKPSPLKFKSIIIAEYDPFWECVYIPSEQGLITRKHCDPKQLRRLAAWLIRAAKYIEWNK